MKNSTTTVLNVVLGIFLVVTVVFWIQTYFLSAEVRSLNGQIAAINGWRQALQSLAADSAEYSKKNPDINPILEPVIGKPPTPAK